MTGFTAEPKNVHQELQNAVFISCKNLDEQGIRTRDADIAAEVYNFLTGKGLSVFLSYLTLEELGASNYTRAIDSALESASVLLAIGTSADHLNSNWVRYEWDSFSNAIRSGSKPNGRVFTYIEGMPIGALPWALRQTQTFVHSEASLQRLYNFINKALPPSESLRLVTRRDTPTHGGRPAALSREGKHPTPGAVSGPETMTNVPKLTTDEGLPYGHIFISYANEDRPAAKRIRDLLVLNGCYVWFDLDDLPFGVNWDDEMQTHITERSALFLSVISSNTEAITEGYLHKERRAAAERAESFGGQVFYYIPFVIDETRPPFKREPKVFNRTQPGFATGGELSLEQITRLRDLQLLRQAEMGVRTRKGKIKHV